MKRMLGGIVAAVAALLLSNTAGTAQTVKVGLLLTYSGPIGISGENQDKGAKLYLKHHEKELGNIKLEILRRDEAFSADVSKPRVQEMIVRDKIDILAGIIGSHVAAAIAPLVNEAKLPTVLMNAASSFVTTLSPYYVRSGATVWQIVYPYGKWAAEKGGVKSIDIAASDVTVGNDMIEAFTKGFTDGGGTVRNVTKIPVNTTDFAPFVQRIKDAKPEALFTFIATPGPFIKTVMELGLDTAGIKLLLNGEMTYELEMPSLTNIRPGIITAHHYSSAGDRPANKAFLEAWRQEYGNDPASFLAVGGWDGMDMIVKAIKAQNGKLDRDKTIELLRNYKNPNSPRGPIEMDSQTGDLVQNVYIRRLVQRDGKFVNEEFETLPMVKDPWRGFQQKK